MGYSNRDHLDNLLVMFNPLYTTGMKGEQIARETLDRLRGDDGC